MSILAQDQFGIDSAKDAPTLPFLFHVIFTGDVGYYFAHGIFHNSHSLTQLNSRCPGISERQHMFGTKISFSHGPSL
jgi:hypothetical protein